MHSPSLHVSIVNSKVMQMEKSSPINAGSLPPFYSPFIYYKEILLQLGS